MAVDATRRQHGLSARTLRKVEHASGELAAKSVAAMANRLPWFAHMPADQRASVLLITQTSASAFVQWLRAPETPPSATNAFRDAPPELSRWINLRHTVVLIRTAIEVFEQELPKYAADEAERAALTEHALRYGREVAFAAATTYATAAESRGAWDARLEALVVDGIVRGDAEESLLSRAAALGWNSADAATVIVGPAPSDDPPSVVRQVHARAGRIHRSVLIGVQGSRLIVVVAGPTDGETPVLDTITDAFGDGPVVAGPTVGSLADAHLSASEALSGIRAVAGWPAAPRPVRASELLPERALAGDVAAERQLIDGIARELEAAGSAIEETVAAYLESGGVLEACARSLYVHSNTVRYRLKRASELTGYNPMDPRDALVLRIALMAGRLARTRTTP